MLEKKPHEHAALIHAWADGATIQVRNTAGFWQDVIHSAPSWMPTLEYRIKPVPKPDVVNYFIARESHGALLCKNREPWHNVQCIFDGVTGVLKSIQLLSEIDDE